MFYKINIKHFLTIFNEINNLASLYFKFLLKITKHFFNL